jgi:hypothetical protein
MSTQRINPPCQFIKRNKFVEKMLSAPVGATAAALMLAIITGCMSLSMSIGCKTGPDGTVCQEGKVSLEHDQELDVYYPVPYASPPNLEIEGVSDGYEIIEQKADHFRIRCKVLVIGRDGRTHWNWKARGSKCSPGAAPTVIVTPPAPPPALPPLADGASVPLPAPTPVQKP